jgi:hypothetical protein
MSSARGQAKTLPPEDLVVLTNIGEAFQRQGIWFKWWPEMQQGGRVGIRDQSRITTWSPLTAERMQQR